MDLLNLQVDPIPVWRPRDSVPIKKIPKWVDPYYVEKARGLEDMAKLREAEALQRKHDADPSQITEDSESTDFLGTFSKGLKNIFFSSEAPVTTTSTTTTASTTTSTVTSTTATTTSPLPPATLRRLIVGNSCKSTKPDDENAKWQEYANSHLSTLFILVGGLYL